MEITDDGKALSSFEWPLWWRITILLNVCVYTMLGNMFAAGITPLFRLIIEDFHVSTNRVSSLSSYALLALGLSNLFAVVASKYIGKRYTTLISLAAFTAVNVWTVYTRSFGSLLATRVVGGLCGGVIETLGPDFVVHLFQEKQLASAMVVYVGFLAGGSALGPIIAGLLGSATGEWQWYFKFLAILSGINVITCILMLPETTDDIPNDFLDNSGQLDSKNDTEQIRTESATPTSPPNLLTIWVSRSFKMGIFDFKRDLNALQYLYTPFTMILQPPVIVTIMIFGLTIGWSVASSIILSNVFQEPPMLWSSRAVGFLSISPLVGLICGLPIGGVLADKLSSRSARQFCGIHVPESRLVLVTIGAVLSPLGVLIIGITLGQHTGWVGQAFGWGLLSLGLTASANILITYAIDCHPLRAPDIALLVNFTKNLLAFGVSLRSMDWYAEDGPVKQFGVMAGTLWACYLFVLPLYFFGAKLRAHSSFL
ncbi:hypothetical protein N7537_001842 [Penicillium hordei]|uniref:Major facilitator superfamily (MFS) profile domain-containing protein n=1 Tax=Penicillium hordei TaxID=40994 RepID=A0AAD6EGA1_9EURO|nr:uncharacterized protein N7537_001842 [Penicillium hordei]KAJ5616728.1 hypothetical protein N7537_001842 [Penicillium hordei]